MAKKICLYGILSAVCMVLGYIEHIVTFDFIAPGIKLGLANSVVLLLVAFGDVKGAFAVNIVRIIISALLFSSPFSLFYSLPAGIFSIIVMWLFKKIKSFSIVGFSIAGATVHNLTQLIIALAFLGQGVLYYSPFLLISAVISGILTGIVAKLVSSKIRF